jgi:hypothetical protein
MAVKEKQQTQPFYTIFLLRQMENKKYITGPIYEKKICMIYEVMAQWLNTVHCPAVCMALWIGSMQGQGKCMQK